MKVKKKFVPSGAPLYMSQFTMIMLILIVMCMIMSVMANKQDAVGKMTGDGMGKVRNANALGIVIGSGVFRFGSNGKARTFADNPGDLETDSPQNPHMDLLKGEGGSGNTDLKASDIDKAKFIFAKLNSLFPPKSASLTKQIDSELMSLGTGMSMFDFDLTIKCYCAEYPDATQNRDLAFERGLRIIRELNKRFNVSLAKMTCVVYDNLDLIDKDAPKNLDGETAAPEAAEKREGKPLQAMALVIRVK